MNNEEANAISKASYMAGVLDERSQWYKKINEKIEDLQNKIDGDDYWKYTESQYLGFYKQIDILKELIGKEE